MTLKKIFEEKGILSKHFDKYEFRPEQVKMAEMVEKAMLDESVALIEGGTGIGKCHKKGTKILMFNGDLKKVEDIIIGDLVMGDNSKHRKVMNVVSGKQKMFKIKPIRSTPFTVNKDHILVLRKTGTEVVTEISVGEYIQKSDKFKHLHKLFTVEVAFPKKPVLIDPYFLGLWLGDGNKHDTGITTEDKEVVDYLKNMVKDMNGYYISVKGKKKKCATYKITRGNIGGYGKTKNELHKQLCDIGVINNKHIPNNYTINHKNIQLKLLAGLLDSDGSYRHGGFDFYNTNERIIDSVVFIVRSLGLRATKRKKYTWCNNKKFLSFVVGISGDCSIIPTRIKRKQSPKRKQIKNVLNFGFSIKSVGVGKYYGFSLNGNYRYLLANFIVSHNSFAYLIPAILSGKKVIVSTSNKSLQDQLGDKDLPALKKIFDEDFTWAVLKGKNNYFCEENFKINEDELLELTSEGELKSIVDWVKKDGVGDISYYPEHLDPAVKELLVCSSDIIHKKDASATCYANLAKERTKKAQIILVNHTLLALDASLRLKTDGEKRILPEADLVVLDEAHAFEKYASMAFSDEINIFSLRHFLNRAITKTAIPKHARHLLENEFRTALQKYTPEKKNGYFVQKKMKKFVLAGSMIDKLERMVEQIGESPKLLKDEATQLKINAAVREGNNLISRLKELGGDNENTLRWAEAYDPKNNTFKPTVTLKSVPLNIGPLLKQTLFEDGAVICTSATLASGGSFRFFKDQFELEDVEELIVGSPFDYKTNAMIYITNGDKERTYELEKLLEYSEGKAFVLFTSYRDMNHFYEYTETKYPKLVQSKGVSRKKLLDDFEETENAVLFGTRSFWEGVDIKDNGLVLVVIHKVPFGNPSDLVYTSKAERIEKRYGKGSHWNRYTIPDACLKIKQGVGRLIRSKTDYGVIAILDERLNYRSYKTQVLASLPPAPRTQKLENVKEFFEKNGNCKH